jgi:hypothetical protein
MYKISLVSLLVFFCATFALAQKEEYHKVEVSVGYSHMVANGIIGDGELYSDDPEEPLTNNLSSITSPSPDLTANPGNLFFEPVINTGKRHRRGLNGFNASVAYNFSKYIGAKFEVSGHYRSGEARVAIVPAVAPYNRTTFQLLPIQNSYPPNTIRSLLAFGDNVHTTKQQHYNFLGGVQIKNNSKEKTFKPFAHVLAGVSRQSVKFDFGEITQRQVAIFGSDEFTNTGFTMALGGGIDIRLGRRIDLRVIQVDYNPVRIKQQQILAYQQPLTNLGLQNNLSFTNISTATLYSNTDIRINSRWQNNFRIGIGIVFH